MSALQTEPAEGRHRVQVCTSDMCRRNVRDGQGVRSAEASERPPRSRLAPFAAVPSVRFLPPVRRLAISCRCCLSPPEHRRALFLEGGAALSRVLGRKADGLQVALVFDRLFRRHRMRRARLSLAVSAAIGAREAIVRAIALARGSSAAGSTTSLTRPQASALSATIGSPVMIISAALDMPIEWARCIAMPPPPIQPSLISGAANWAFSEAMRMSHDIAVSSPPPRRSR